jgi:hypothetical protein
LECGKWQSTSWLRPSQFTHWRCGGFGGALSDSQTVAIGVFRGSLGCSSAMAYSRDTLLSSPVVLQPPHVRWNSAGEWLARPDTGVGFLAAPVGRSDRDRTIAPLRRRSRAQSKTILKRMSMLFAHELPTTASKGDRSNLSSGVPPANQSASLKINDRSNNPSMIPSVSCKRKTFFLQRRPHRIFAWLLFASRRF